MRLIDYKLDRYSVIGVILVVILISLTSCGEDLYEHIIESKTNIVLKQVPNLLTNDHITEVEYQQTNGFYLGNRVTTPVSQSVVRSGIDKHTAMYQEADTYNLLINSPKFPSVTKLQDGTYFMLVSGVPAGIETRVGYQLRSTDGFNWSQPEISLAYRARPNAVGKYRIVANSGSEYHISEDMGITWSSSTSFPTLPDGRPLYSDTAYSPLIDGDSLTYMLWAPVANGLDGAANWSSKLFTQAVLITLNSVTGTWSGLEYLPLEWNANEGSVTRNKSGELVIAYRTQYISDIAPTDSWMGLAVVKQTRDEKGILTWGIPKQIEDIGHVHTSFNWLSTGDLLLTYAVRMGQLDGKVSHGIECVVSHDQGETYDWNHKYIVARFDNALAHSPSSIQLGDGRILTTYMDDIVGSWVDDGSNTSVHALGKVSSTIWEIK